MPRRVSSNMTIILKLFLPTVWIVFFLSFTVAVWLADEANYGTMSPQDLRMILPVFLLVGIALLYWSVMRLKRIEMDATHLYATNYIKTYRYSYDSIEKIREKDFLFLRTVHIYLKQKGNFGKKMTFIASRFHLQDFLTQHPQVVEQLWETDE